MLHMSDRTIRILLLAVIIFFLIILCVVVIDYIRKTKKNRMYVQLFEETYKNNSVIDTLLKIIEVYKIRSVENLVLRKAINYLQKSCLKDYQTAFAIIEDVFSGKKVKELHNTIIENEKGKLVLLLEKKNY